MTNELVPATDDERLSAYLDDMLPVEERAALERRLAAEPALAARLRALARADVAVRQAYAPAIEEPLPQSVLALLERERGDATAAAAAPPVVDLAARREARVRRVGAAPAALAAGIALVVGVVAGIAVAPRPSAPGVELSASGGLVPRAAMLHGALERTPSGTEHALGGGAVVTPVLSFRTAEGGICRQFAIRAEPALAEGVACREEGGWRVAAFAAGPAEDARGFRLAAGGASLIDDAVDAAIAGEPLSADAEAELLEAGWPSASANASD